MTATYQEIKNWLGQWFGINPNPAPTTIQPAPDRQNDTSSSMQLLDYPDINSRFRSLISTTNETSSVPATITSQPEVGISAPHSLLDPLNPATSDQTALPSQVISLSPMASSPSQSNVQVTSETITDGHRKSNVHGAGLIMHGSE